MQSNHEGPKHRRLMSPSVLREKQSNASLDKAITLAFELHLDCINVAPVTNSWLDPINLTQIFLCPHLDDNEFCA